MIQLLDTFNDQVISTHRTLRAAVAASRKHDRSVKRANGRNSYIPYGHKDTSGAPISDEEIMAEKMVLDQATN